MPTTTEKYAPTFEDAQKLATRFETIAQHNEMGEIGRAISDEAGQLGSRPYRLAVVGEIKKGKSSFINALIGRPELTPTSTDVATSTVYRIGYGSTDRITVHFLPDDDQDTPPPIQIGLNDVVEYGTEDDNPGNHKNVDHIEIAVPSEFLQTGIELIDTPGLGALFSKHGAVTWRHVPSADAVMFVLDSKESVMTKDEVAYLRRIHMLGLPVFFVQTKIDLANPETWREWVNRNLEIIGKTLAKPTQDLRYFAISSTHKLKAETRNSAKHLERSGFPALESFFHTHLIPALKSKKAANLLVQMNDVLSNQQKQHRERHRIATQKSQKEVEDIEKEYREKRRTLQRWREREYQTQLRMLRQASDDHQRQLRDEIDQIFLPPEAGPLWNELGPLIDRASENPDNIDAATAHIDGETRRICADLGYPVLRTYATRLTESLQSALNQLGTSINRVAGTSVQSDFVETGSSTNQRLKMTHNSALRANVKAGVYGAMTGTIAYGLIGVILPPAGMAGIIVGIWAFASERKAVKAQRSDEARRKLVQMSAHIVNQARAHFIRQAEAQAVQVRRTTEELFEQTLHDRQEEVEQLLLEAEESKSLSKELNQQRASNIRLRIDEIDVFLQDVAKAYKPKTLHPSS